MRWGEPVCSPCFLLPPFRADTPVCPYKYLISPSLRAKTLPLSQRGSARKGVGD